MMPPAPTPAVNRLPLFGGIARYISQGGLAVVWLVIALVLVGVVLAVLKWGLVALVMVMIAFVPVMFTAMAVVASPWARSSDDDH